ncbi:hypothetical protein FEM48_Zijuj09G0215600 [Ziziphus jujuba var. spinosa]|uniref:Amidase domain-containing protein n=1 Tax=Ziziphus jujuba var. spinosa TaxID=714518 RepID=A0A978UVF6_ZIZJJ|nr:hypothetical protein FEM48_Zijuj09G0215600 [Ziziphus jujuba var. spinosa]
MLRKSGSKLRLQKGGNPLSILDGIFVAIKDDIDCYPNPTTGYMPNCSNNFSAMVVKRLSDSCATDYHKVMNVSIGFYEEDVLEIVMKGQVVEYEQSKAFLLHINCLIIQLNCILTVLSLLCFVLVVVILIQMRKKRVMVPVEEVLSAVKYEEEEFQGNFQIYSYIADLRCTGHELEMNIEAPHMTGFLLKLVVCIIETPLIGPLVISFLRKQNKFDELVWHELEPKPGVVMLDEEGKPEERLELALKSLPQYDPASCWNGDSTPSFQYWKISDYAHAYCSGHATPSTIVEHVISVIKELSGNPLSILDGIFVAIKDDIHCYPHPTTGATTWMHEVCSVMEDAICISRLHRCGVTFVEKTNLHELDMGTAGNNPNYCRNVSSLTIAKSNKKSSCTRKVYSGSSSASAAIVASGICPTDGRVYSVRIPSSLCGAVCLKTTFGCTDVEGSLCSGTLEIIGTSASTVEDTMLVQENHACNRQSCAPLLRIELV